jgi:hypothetical protein
LYGQGLCQTGLFLPADQADRADRLIPKKAFSR